MKPAIGGLVMAALAAATLARAQVSPTPEPYRRTGGEPLDFRGPGREEPEPDVDEVVLAWFGPGDPDHPDFGELWRGATLALEQENAAGGYRGRAFRLVPAWSESPWKAGIADLTRLVYDRHAWAVIGGVDGTTTHLAVQIALKSHFLLLSPGSTDASADHANVPWLFSLPPSDELVAPVLAEAIGTNAAGGFAIVASTDHDSHATLVALRRALGERRLTPAALVEFAPLEADFPALAGRLRREAPRLVVVLAPSTLAGRVVAAIRRSGYGGTIVGSAPAARSAFRRAAGAAAEGMIVPLAAESGPAWETFALAYEARWGQPPDEAAAQGYDAVRLVAAAVRRAGLNRALIRDAVRALAPWPGVSGTVAWSPLGRNQRAVSLGTWRDGRLERSPCPRREEDLDGRHDPPPLPEARRGRQRGAGRQTRVRRPVGEYRSVKAYHCRMVRQRFVYWQDGDAWLGYLEEFPDYVTQGDSLDDLKEHLRDIYADVTSGVIPAVRRAADLDVA